MTTCLGSGDKAGTKLVATTCLGKKEKNYGPTAMKGEVGTKRRLYDN